LNLALRTSLKSAETIDLGLRLAGAIQRYWEVRSYLTEGYEHYQTLLARTTEATDPALRAKAELGAARLSWCQDRDADALRHYHTAQRIYEGLGMTERVGIIEAFIGFTEYNEGNNDAARKHFERAQGLAKELGSERVEAMALHGFGNLAAAAGDLAASRAAKVKAIEVFRRLGDLWAVSLITGCLGKACLAQKDYAAARHFLKEALTISGELGNKWSIPYALEAIADVCAAENQAAKAVRLYGAASAQREALALAFSPTEENSYRRSVMRLHELLPETPFKEEWNKGRALGFQAAIHLGMEAA
jgi:tetratricopeptide (TPR) repeat protein